ncbi:MAG: hypothetical protein L3J41_12585 [Melioribacteraceae bacterium]|nr:hypothetical protein [Melioribacteraceae bacterium]
MKIVISFLLVFSTLLFSQTNYYPDKLVSKYGGVQGCFLVEINENYITTKAKNNSRTKFFLTTLDEIIIDGLGTVYTTSTGFNKTLDSISTFLNERNSKYSKLNEQETKLVSENIPRFNSDKKFFFAIHYFPSITKQLLFTYNPYYYSISQSSYMDQIYRPIYFELEQNIVSMESQFGFNVRNNFFVTLSLGYSSDLYKSRSTTTNFNTSDNSGIKRVTESQNSMDKFLFEFGIKYYFGNFEINNVNPFITFSIGKQFAFVDNYNNTYVQGQNNDYSFTNNENEFMEGLNSPIFASIGFGAEYFIAKSFSLSGFFKTKYNSASATYTWKETHAGNVTNQGEQDVENKSVKFKTGIGLTFFF